MTDLYSVGTYSINVLALSADNTARLQEISDNKVIVGVMAKDYPGDQELLDFFKTLNYQGALVSLGLGGGDPGQALRVAELCPRCGPAHVNQVFTLAAYTQGLLAGQGLPGVVNALVGPGPDDDTVVLSTGPKSSTLPPAVVACSTAAEMIAEMQIHSVKFFPLNNRLNNMVKLAASCAQAGIPVFEPTGGIEPGRIAEIVRACLNAGSQVVIPHVYTALVKDGRTDYAAFTQVWRDLAKL